MSAARIYTLTRDDNDREQWDEVGILEGHWSPISALLTWLDAEDDPPCGTYKCVSASGKATVSWDGSVAF